MRIAIVGGGKVGYSLAEQLQQEDHDITVIDKNEKVIEQIGNQLDVIGFVGNGASYAALESAGVRGCDLLIAVTASDEVNMFCCLVAHKLGAKQTIARVRNPEYHGQLYVFKNDLGLSMAINPEQAAANEIARILRFPSATKVELFANGRVELVSFTVSAGGMLDGLRLSDLRQKTGVKVLICAVDRNGDVYIPDGNFVAKADDILYLTGAPAEMTKAFRKFHMLVGRAKNVFITGGGRITYYLASELTAEDVNVKIVEQDPARARALAELLPKAMVLCGDAADHELLQEEGLDEQDAFVALTGLDEGNILSALYAHNRRVGRVIAKVNNDNLRSLIRNSGLQSTISPKQITANQILRFARALDAGNASDDIRSLYKLMDGRVEVLEFLADAACPLNGRPLRSLTLKRDVLIACLVREGKAIIPGGDDSISAGDSVLVVTAAKRINELNDIAEEAHA